MRRIAIFIGTRPEAIKMAPVIAALKRSKVFEPLVVNTGQHRELIEQVIDLFEIEIDRDLAVMEPNQSLAPLLARLLTRIDIALSELRPDMVLAQGDTSTVLATALAAFYRHIPFGHVEAGLRTGNLEHPFPEEMNRLVTGRLAALHFAPTAGARRNLLVEGVPGDRILVTGNSGIDAVLHVAAALETGRFPARVWPWLDSGKRLIVVTAHRRESFGAGFERICEGLARLAERPDVQIVYPVHRNPNVLDPVTRLLEGRPNIVLIDPLDYVSFVDLMRRAYLLISDSGGIQEEAPSLGKPVLVMRETTERPEAVEAGTVKLVGTDAEKIAGEAARLLDDEGEYERTSRIHNPYGDGHASERITAAIEDF